MSRVFPYLIRWGGLWVALLLAAAVGVWGTPKCPLEETVDISGGELDADGYIEYRGVRYGRNDYFTEGEVVRGCVCRIRKCVSLCCINGTRMITGDQEFCSVDKLDVNVSRDDSYEVMDVLADPRFWGIYLKPACPYPSNLMILESHEYTLRVDGLLDYETSLFDFRSYCIFTKSDEQLPQAIYCEDQDITRVHRIYSVGLIISIPFLLATLIVYGLLPELRNVPGKSLMCYVLGLTISYLFLTLVKLNSFGYQTVGCKVAGYVSYFATLLSFFWLSAMAFDIFWTFGGSRGITSDRKKFLYYCLYAWGIPSLTLVYVLIVDHTEFIGESLRPAFGIHRCLFSRERLVGFLYFYLPLLLLMSANVFFFLMTAIRIHRVEKATAAALQGESRRHTKYEKDRYRFNLYLRLFIIMGVTWTFEFFTWLFDDDTWLVYMVDICNCINGVFIFFLFVWKQKVKDLLWKRVFGKRADRRSKPLTSDSATRSTGATGKFGTTTDVSMVGLSQTN